MTVVFLDSCDCIIEYNRSFNWVKTIKKCRLHKKFEGQRLLNEAFNQNRRFNMALGQINLDESDIEEIIISKEVNKQRIRFENLDNYHEHLAEHHTRSFFDNLKRILTRLNPL